jgi:hypothetical protein
MAIHWQIPFISLRTGIIYTINVYDASYDDDPITLSGGGTPIVTQEDNDEDFFCNIRTQSGALRLLDTGKDANGNSLGADWWKMFVPDSDTDRPLTITHMEPNPDAEQEGEPEEIEVTDWQGFIQAQNAGFTLYGDPQEKEFPIQCALTVLEGSDIDYAHKEIENFAYILRECLNEIDKLSGGTVSGQSVTANGAIHINSIYIQGGTDARIWLLKRVDRQNFVSKTEDGIEARYTLFEVLQDMCRYWGWTARTHRDTLYLTRADDSDRTTFTVLTREQLATLAGGTDAGTTDTFDTIALSGDLFVNMNNIDYRQRGHNKAMVKADCNAPQNDLIVEMDEQLKKLMAAQGWEGGAYTKDGVTITYTTDLLTFSLPFLAGSCRSGYAAFAIGTLTSTTNQSDGDMNMVRIKKSFSTVNAAAYAQFTSVYHHCFADGFLIMHAKTYRRTEIFEDAETGISSGIGRKHMYMKLGIGKTRATAVWYNGNTWSSTESAFKATIGNTGDNLYAKSISGNFRRVSIPTPDAEGLLFVELLGSDDLDKIDNERSFELDGFCIEYFKSVTGVNRATEKPDLPNEMEYTSRNQNNVRSDWNADCIFASNKDSAYGYGLLINTDGTFVSEIAYNSVNYHPEQHLANRVTNYWNTARRMVDVEMRSDNADVQAIDPSKKVTLDSTTFYPIAISRDWRDDISEITMLELPTE